MINPRTGLAGDMLFAALFDLIEKEGKEAHIEELATFLENYGTFEIYKEERTINNDIIIGKKVVTEYKGPSISFLKARHLISSGITHLKISRSSALVARRALEILISAETKAHQVLGNVQKREKTVQGSSKSRDSFYKKNFVFPAFLDGKRIRIVGYVNSPYKNAPLQPENQISAKGPIKIVIDPALKDGLKDLETFEKIWVISFLHKSKSFSSPIVFPPWDEKANPRGVFATRSPVRPSPIGLSKAEIVDITDNEIIVKSLDLINETPVLDIKPVLATIDLERSNDGWLEDTQHLELHKKGIPHLHDENAGHLHEAADIVFDILGVAYLLDKLKIKHMFYLGPVYVGSGKLTFSHGTLEIPTPATREILYAHNIFWDFGPFEKELLTPTGASILAALKPQLTTKERMKRELELSIKGIGWGHRDLPIGNYLEIWEANKKNI